MNEFLTNLRRQAEENPMFALAAGAAVMTAIAKFISASVDRRNSRAWVKEVNRRYMKDSRQK